MSIRSPKTGRMIKINGPTYNMLKTEGYFKPQTVKSQLLPDEIIIEEIIMHADTPDFMAICNTNKKFKSICDNELFWKKMVYKYYADSGLLTLKKSYAEIFKIAYHLSLLHATSTSNTTLLDWYEFEQITIHQGWPQKLLDAIYYMNSLEIIIFQVKDFENLQKLTHYPPNLKKIKYVKI